MRIPEFSIAVETSKRALNCTFAMHVQVNGQHWKQLWAHKKALITDATDICGVIGTFKREARKKRHHLIKM